MSSIVLSLARNLAVVAVGAAQTTLVASAVVPPEMLEAPIARLARAE